MIGVRLIRLACAVRDIKMLSRSLPSLLPDSLYSEDHGPIEEEVEELSSFIRWLLRNDSVSDYYLLEEATRGTPRVSSIK